MTVVFTCRADFYGHVLGLSPPGRPHPRECPGLPRPHGRGGAPGGHRGPRGQGGAGVRAGPVGANPRRHGPGTGTAAAALVLTGTVVEAAAGGGPDQRGVRRDGRGRGGHRDRGRRRFQRTPGTRPGTPVQALHPTGQRRRGIRGHATPGRDDDPGRGGPAPRRRAGHGPAAGHQLRQGPRRWKSPTRP